MPNPLIALSSTPGNVGLSYLSGLQARQSYDKSAADMAGAAQDRQWAGEDRTRAEHERILTVLANASTSIKTPQEFEQFKGVVKRFIPEAAASVDGTTFQDLPAIRNGFVSLADQQKIALGNQALQSGDLGIQGQRLDNQGKALNLQGLQQQNDYWNGQLGTTPSAAPSGGGYADRLFQSESGNNPNARASTSTAQGYGQFIDSTWNSLVNSPEGQAAGLTPDGRSDRQQSLAALKIYNDRTASLYQRAGIPMTQKTAYFAALLGPAGAVKAFRSDPNAIAAQVFPQEAAANKALFYDNGQPRTIQQLYEYQTRKFPDAPLDGIGAGNGAGYGAQPQPSTPASATNPSYQLGNGSLLAVNAPNAPAAPQGQPQPSASPQAPQSVAELAASDPLYQRYAQEAVKAQRFGNTAGAAQANALAEARLKELQATLPPVLAPKDQQKALDAERKAKNASNDLVEAAKGTLGTIQEAKGMLEGSDAFRTGMGGAVAAYIPGSGARDLSNAIMTIKANLSFEALQQMRANSPTGGALGNVSDADLKLLASQVAALDYTGKKDKLKRDLALVEQHYQRLLDAAQADAGMGQGGSDVDALLQKYGVQ
jgi:hypothetical protein